MAGFAGIVDWQLGPDALMESLGQAVGVLSEGGMLPVESASTIGAAVVAVQSRGHSVQGGVAEDEKGIVVFAGTLYDEAGLHRARYEQGTSRRPPSLADDLLGEWRASGVKGLEGLNGRLAVVLWDKGARRLTFIGDRYGFAPIYYARYGSRICFSSEFGTLVKISLLGQRVDEDALVSLLSFGYCLGEATLLRDVRVLPHGTAVEFSETRPPVARRYWNYEARGRDATLFAVDEYVEQYFDILTRVVLRQADGRSKVALPVSGGLDSRTIAGILGRERPDTEIVAFSYGNPDCFDLVFGRQLARRLGFEHNELHIIDTSIRDCSEEFVRVTGGSIDCMNRHMVLAREFVSESGAEAIFTGFLGDTVCGYLIVGPEILTKVLGEDEFCSLAVAGNREVMSESDLGWLLRPEVFRRVKESAAQQYRHDLSEAPLGSRYFQLVYAELIGRQRRYTSFNVSSFEGVSEVLVPFADNEFVDFALAVPDVLKADRYLQRHAIIKYLPEAASVPWNKTGLPMNPSRLRTGLQWRWEKALRNPIVRATVGRRAARMNDNYLRTGDELKKGSREFAMKRILDSEVLVEIFEPNAVKDLLDRVLQGKEKNFRKITVLLTFALWADLYVLGKRGSL